MQQQDKSVTLHFGVYKPDLSICNLATLKIEDTLGRNLEMNFVILHQFFQENYMTLNQGKCHNMIIGSKDKVTSSNEEKLLFIFLDSKLTFESHIGSLCRKAGQKINTLARSKSYLISDQRNLLLNSVIKSQFTYCPLI